MNPPPTDFVAAHDNLSTFVEVVPDVEIRWAFAAFRPPESAYRP